MCNSMLDAMIIKIKMDKKESTEKDYVSVGGFEMQDPESGCVYGFDFENSYLFVNKSKTSVWEYSLERLDTEAFPRAKLITPEFVKRSRITEFYTDTEASNVLPEKVISITFLFNDGTRVDANKEQIKQATKAMIHPSMYGGGNMKYKHFKNTYSSEDECHNTHIFIDGYPCNKNEEGAVIAEVCGTPHGDIVVSWHLNEYRLNRKVLKLIKESIIDLLDNPTIYADINMQNEVLKEIYEGSASLEFEDAVDCMDELRNDREVLGDILLRKNEDIIDGISIHKSAGALGKEYRNHSLRTNETDEEFGRFLLKAYKCGNSRTIFYEFSDGQVLEM